MARRRLSPEERELWRKVAQTASPLHAAAAPRRAEPAIPARAAVVRRSPGRRSTLPRAVGRRRRARARR